MKEAAKLLKVGYAINIVFAPHPSLQEGWGIPLKLWENEDFVEIVNVAPLADHWDIFPVRWLAEKYGIEVLPIVTRHAKEKRKHKYPKIEVRDRLSNYVTRMNEAFTNGKVAYETIYADREANLRKPDLDVIGLLESRTRDVRNWALLFMYVHDPEASGKSDIRGFAPKHLYEYHFGPLYTIEGAKSMAGETPLSLWALEQLSEMGSRVLESRRLLEM